MDDNISENDNYDERLNSEIERRIDAMERPDYVFPARFSKRHYLVAAIVAIACLALIITGAFIR